jgi:2-keto-4-pentenoate hydratase/2-oxohepta-3-ene-1,7-dioic acid hydratase in catechol pathway
MVFSFAEYLAFLSIDFTFVPGDVILGGTGAGTAQDSTKPNADGTRPRDLFLKKGDTVAISSPSIGVLENRIV